MPEFGVGGWSDPRGKGRKERRRAGSMDEQLQGSGSKTSCRRGRARSFEKGSRGHGSPTRGRGESRRGQAKEGRSKGKEREERKGQRQEEEEKREKHQGESTKEPRGSFLRDGIGSRPRGEVLHEEERPEGHKEGEEEAEEEGSRQHRLLQRYKREPGGRRRREDGNRGRPPFWGEEHSKKAGNGNPRIADGRMAEGSARISLDCPGADLGCEPGPAPATGGAIFQKPVESADDGTTPPRVPHAVCGAGPGSSREDFRKFGCDPEVEVPDVQPLGHTLHHKPTVGDPSDGKDFASLADGDARSSAWIARGAEGLRRSISAQQTMDSYRRPGRTREEQRKGRQGEERQEQRRERKRRRKGAGSTRSKEVEGNGGGYGETPVAGDGDKRQLRFTGFPDGEASRTMKGRRLESGGADEGLVQTSRLSRAEDGVWERIRLFLSSNSFEKLSLLSVGSLLFQCFVHCCKPWSMVEVEGSANVEKPTLTGTVQDDPAFGHWEDAVSHALESMAGRDFSKDSGFFVDDESKRCVREQLLRFDVWDENLCEAGFEKFFSSKNIDYSGEEIKLAQNLVWEAVAGSFPGEVGHLELSQFCTLGTQDFVLNFEKYLLPEEDQHPCKAPRVMVQDGEWPLLCQGLVEKGVCTVLPIEEVHTVKGQPLLNGLFAVGKNEFIGNLETQRLIMNLTPVNQLVREVQGDIATLPCLSNFGLLTLGENEELLVSSEDVRCFFYLFRTPKTWHRYMAFNLDVPPELVPSHLAGRRCVLAATVLPMGFQGSVSIAQHVHRNVVNWAAASQSTPVGGEGEIRKDLGFPMKTDRYRIYLDNFDQLEVMDKRLAETLQGTTSDQVEHLRQVYADMKIPRHPKKAVSRQLRAEVQGSLVLGDKGIAIPKPQKIAQYVSLTLSLLKRGECKLKELQVVCGGLVYVTTFRRPLLSNLNQVWRFMEDLKNFPPVVRMPIPDRVSTELLRFLCLIPLGQISFRSRITGMVTCSDASETGGGICLPLLTV